jgi:hypothetical protein
VYVLNLFHNSFILCLNTFIVIVLLHRTAYYELWMGQFCHTEKYTTLNRIILPNIQHAVTDFYFKKFHRIKKGM